MDHSIECHYSNTTRRHRGSSKDKTKRLQQRLEDAERLLRTFGALNCVGSGCSPLSNHGANSQMNDHSQRPFRTDDDHGLEMLRASSFAQHRPQASDELAEIQQQDSGPSLRINSRDSSVYAYLSPPSSANLAGREAAPLTLEAVAATAPVICHNTTGPANCDSLLASQSISDPSHENTEIEAEPPVRVPLF
jgi:hypothetical protein